MKVVRDRADARWLPSRHHFALSRLIAFAMLQRTPARAQPGLVLTVDRDQSAAENYAVAIWTYTTLATYCAALLARRMPLWAAAILAIPVAAVAIELPVYATGGILVWLWNRVTGGRLEGSRDVNSTVVLALLFLASLYFATQTTWVRTVAWLAIALFVLNGAAAAILRRMRGAVRAAEQRCGA